MVFSLMHTKLLLLTLTGCQIHTVDSLKFWAPLFIKHPNSNVILCPNFGKNLNKESMHIFGSNCRTNVGTMDTLIDIEYESGDSQAIIDNTR